MAFPITPGWPAYSGTIIPEVWSGKVLRNFYDATVLGEITNTDYSGDIKNQGDKVIIRTTPTLTIRDYVEGQQIEYELPEPTILELLIDQAKLWAFRTGDISSAQADIPFTEAWTKDASEQLKITIDTTVLGSIYSDVHAGNTGTTAGVRSASYDLGASGSPIAATKANIIDYIVDMGSCLDEQNIPETGRFLVIPPWACGLIKSSDLKDASLSGDGTSMLRNGRVGMIDRFTIFSSNLLATTTDGVTTGVTYMLFGHKLATSFATQLVKNEGPIRSEKYFGNFYRGLQVFGYKVVKPEGLGLFYAYKG